MLKISKYKTLVLLSFLFLFNCKTTPQVKKITKQAVTVKQNKTEDSLVIHIKKNLPNLKKGMSRYLVDAMLTLDTKFNGILTSEGTKRDFSYYYDLKGYELVLHYDYSKQSFGEFTGFLFTKT